MIDGSYVVLEWGAAVLRPYGIKNTQRSFKDVTLRVSPSRSPLTSARRWSYLSEAFSAATTSLFPSASSLMNCLSLVMMPYPLPWHFNAQSRV
jgi:hypothetical protein